MDSERPKNFIEEEKTERSEILPVSPEITPEKGESGEGEHCRARIEEIKRQLQSKEKTDITKVVDSSPLSISEGNIKLSVNADAVKSFLLAQGLSEEQASDLKIKFSKLHWSNKATRFFASFLLGRFREIFTRIESLKGDTLEIFTNNLDSVYDAGDAELIARDTIHHLVHFAQRKRGMSRFAHFFTRLPIIHGLSKYEKEARSFAKEADLENGPWANVIQFSSRRGQGSGRLKIKV